MKENIKIPPAGIEPRGEITIEVSDAKTGEIVERHKKENYVNEGVLRAIMAVNVRKFFNGVNDLSASFRHDILMNTLLLTDFAGATKPGEEFFVEGNRIGYGVRDQPATGADRGAWNDQESILRSDYVKLVFDFATSQANGTFQSIYTTRQKSVTLTTGETTPLPLTKLFFNDRPFGVFKAAGSLFLVMSSSGNPWKVWKFDTLDLKQDKDGKLDIAYTEYLIPYTIYEGTLRAKGTDFYFRHTASADRTSITKAPMSNPAGGVKVFTPPYSFSYFDYDEPRDRWLVLNNTTGNIHIYDNNWQEVEVISYYTSTQTNYPFGMSADGKFIFQEYFIYEIATKRRYSFQYGNDSNDYTRYWPPVEIGDFMLMTNAYQYVTATFNWLMLTARPLFFSRVLLDQPVTKTAQQNMKITYEFNIPPLNLLES